LKLAVRMEPQKLRKTNFLSPHLFTKPMAFLFMQFPRACPLVVFVIPFYADLVDRHVKGNGFSFGSNGCIWLYIYRPFLTQ